MITGKLLNRLYRELKRNHPELIGLGIGWRTKSGRLRREPALRLVVEKKQSARNKSVRQFPKHIDIKGSRGKRPISFRIFTDVEQVKKWVPTSFPLLINGAPDMTASCYASWQTIDGKHHIGVVTVAHAIPDVGQPVGITTSAGVLPGIAVLRSDVIQSGLDVGLVELTQSSASYLPCLPSPMNPIAASVDATIGILGISDTDALCTDMENWFSSTPAQGRALAYYATMQIQPSGSSPYTLKSVVLADGPENAYAPGRSGAPWVAKSAAWNPMAIALQSHGNSGLSFREGLGTHLATAIQWLENQLTASAQFSPAWRIGDLP